MQSTNSESSNSRPIKKKASSIIRSRRREVIYNPPDGGWGWLCVFACFLTFALLVGMTRCFGVIYNDVRNAFPESTNVEISMIPSVASALVVGCGVFAGAMSMAFSCRIVAFIGGLLGGLGLSLCYFANSVLYMFFMFLISGIGAGFSCTPGLLMVTKYFRKKRVMAIGFALAGTSIGTMVQPPLVRILADEYGFRGALLIQGGFLFHVCVGALLYREPNVVTNMKRKMSRPPLEASAPSVVHWGSAMTHVPQDDVLSLEYEKRREHSLMCVQLPNPIETCKQIKHRLSIRRHTERKEGRYSLNDQEDTKRCCNFAYKYFFLDLTLLYNPVFVVLLFSTVFLASGYPQSLFYIPSYALRLGYTPQSSSLLLTISSSGDLIGRLAFGWFFDQNFVSKHTGLLFSMTVTSLSIVAVVILPSYTWIACCLFLHGTFAGACFILIPVLLSEYHGTVKVASSFGIVRTTQGLFSLVTPAVVGFIKDKTGSFVYGLLFLGLCMSVSSILMCILIPVKRHYRKKMGVNWPQPHFVP